MKQFSVLAWLWVAVLLATGFVGGVLVPRVGWALAMGFAIYTGNTEPVRPELPYPWWFFGLAAALSAAGLGWWLYRRHRATPTTDPAPLLSLLPLALAYVGGLAAALLPFFQIYRLFSLVG